MDEVVVFDRGRGADGGVGAVEDIGGVGVDSQLSDERRRGGFDLVAQHPLAGGAIAEDTVGGAGPGAGELIGRRRR